jgi:hypothetical protein
MEQNKELLDHLQKKYPITNDTSKVDHGTLIMFRGIFTEGFNLAKDQDSDLLKALQDLVKEWRNCDYWGSDDDVILRAQAAIIKAGGLL